ncbi:MAG: anhydro-N-acetylmuramic acid kinase [bacterium]|nr:anhydro-N-acetylmuramic acid kinase [bacterium]
MLKRLLNKKQLVVLGLNSGTSADALDLAALQIRREGRKVTVKFLSGRTRRYPDKLRSQVIETADSNDISPDRMMCLDNALGQFYGREASRFIKKLAVNGTAVDLVASHGQTARHLPQRSRTAGFTVNGSLQLGSPAQIAAKTGKIVVGDFRQADIALGHEGAPITVAAMARLFAHPQQSQLIVNIGGMSNFFYFPSSRSGQRTQAADCGPGNSLLDLLSQKLYGEHFDRNGRHALAGEVSQRLLSVLLAEPFFGDRAVSTGREAFGEKLAGKILILGKKLRLQTEDLMATTAELTVMAVVQRLGRLVAADRSLTKLCLTGGGLKNRFLKRRLAEIFSDLDVCSVSELGFDPDLVEAAAYAVMGEACLRCESLPTVFGRGGKQKRQPVLGIIAQPPQGV